MSDQVEAAKSVIRRVRALWAPPPTLTVSQWADEYRVLSAESSGEPGQWRTSRAEYQRGIMDALSDPLVEQVTVMSSAQIGKTEFVNNAIGYYVHQDPSPILLVQPTVEAAKKWSKTRLAPMIRDTPVLFERVADDKSRDSSNTIQEKTFPGGLLLIVGSNAPAGLASQPIRIVLCDEVDRFEQSAGTEGDPVDLAFKRTTTFTGRRKHVLISTPGIKGDSRIEKAWLDSDQRHFFVPCPHCGTMQALVWRDETGYRVIWETDEEGNAKLETCAYVCIDCGAMITDSHKPAMLRAGEWRASKPEVKDHAGFHINELYSPWRRFSDVAKDFIKAKRNGIRTLQVWINTALGEPFDPREGGGLMAKGLMARREVYPTDVPQGVILLTAGVDMQDDRIEVSVWGWGQGMEAWLVAHQVIVGNPATPAPWIALDTILTREWKHQNGSSLRIVSAAIDHGGHYGKHVISFCKPRTARGVFAIKGASRPQGKPVKRSKTKTALWLVDTNGLKDTIYAQLRIDQMGPSYVHFPATVGEVYFDQLLSEKPVRRRSGGVDVRIYETLTKDTRNEALDCFVYAMAALERLGIKEIEARAATMEQVPVPPMERVEPAAAESEPVSDPLPPQVLLRRPIPQRVPRQLIGRMRGGW